MKFVWSPQAVGDLSSIRRFIAHDRPEAARRIVGAIITYVESQLTAFPQSGRPGRVAGTYELVVPRLPFIVPYRVKAGRIEILRVYHTARRWPEGF